MAIDVHCPNCEHVWEEEDLFDETDIETETDKFRDRLVIKEDLLGRMREELKAIVDRWDKGASLHISLDSAPQCMTVIFSKKDISSIRRLVEE